MARSTLPTNSRGRVWTTIIVLLSISLLLFLSYSRHTSLAPYAIAQPGFEPTSSPSEPTSAHLLPPVLSPSPSPVSTSTSPLLRVVTYGTHAGYKFCWLVLSAAQERLPLVVLGFGVTHQRGGLGYKLTDTLQYLHTLHDDELVMFVDAFDVVLTNNASQLIRSFLALNATLVFSAEKGCWSYLNGRAHGAGLCLSYYPDKPEDALYRFVNTGSWMGYVWAARRLLNDIVSFHLARTAASAAGEAHIGSLNDQELVTDYFVCDYLQSLYRRGGEAAVVDRVGAVFGDVSAERAAARINACRLTGVERYNVTLDYYASMFQSLHNSEVDQSINAQQRLDIHVDWDDRVGRWRNKAGQYPAIFHFNGGGKAHIDTVWQHATSGYRPLTDLDYATIQRYNASAGRYEQFPVHDVCS